MGAGGVIQQADALVTAAKDPSIYGVLPKHEQENVDRIAAKAPDQRTKQDCEALLLAIEHAVRNGY
ncbi:MAG TPA: hypothetical protein VGL72_30520 [Bryobacteraceae bacterium]|jgi:hypothetical protein